LLKYNKREGGFGKGLLHEYGISPALRRAITRSRGYSGGLELEREPDWKGKGLCKTAIR